MRWVLRGKKDSKIHIVKRYNHQGNTWCKLHHIFWVLISMTKPPRCHTRSNNECFHNYDLFLATLFCFFNYLWPSGRKLVKQTNDLTTSSTPVRKEVMHSNVCICLAMSALKSLYKFGSFILSSISHCIHILHMINLQRILYHILFISWMLWDFLSTTTFICMRIMPSSANHEFWCMCQKYCKGCQRQLNMANTWWHHLCKALEDKKQAIYLAVCSDEFQAFMNAMNNLMSQIGIKRSANDDHSTNPGFCPGQWHCHVYLMYSLYGRMLMLISPTWLF